MNTTLCLDFGNTRLKYAIFKKNILQEEAILQNDSLETVKEILIKHHPQKAILSSVIIHNEELENLLSTQTIFHKISTLTKRNFTVPISKPQTIGADRLALASAATHYYPKKNNLIIALGSCITYNFINQKNEFLGGSISPGMQMRFESMHAHTALLPLINADWNFPIIGYDTKTSLQSGVISGITYEIDGFIDSYKKKFDNLNVVLTGGDSTFFAKQLKNKLLIDTQFLLKGLYALSEINNS